MERTRIKWFAAGLAAYAVATLAIAQTPDWVPLGLVNDRSYVMNRASLAPTDNGFTFAVFSDKAEGAAPDALADGRKYLSSFLAVEVNCTASLFRIARVRFFSGRRAQGEVVAEDGTPPGEGWAPASPQSLGGTFVAAACPSK